MLNRKHIYSILSVVALLAVSVLAIQINQVEAQPQTVYIRANGDVDPPWVLIQRNGDVYVFTGDIEVDGDATGMVIERDNMTLDGAGYSFSREPHVAHSAGIELTDRRNVTIRNLEVKTFWNGIVLWNSSNITLQGNRVTANSNYGISLWNFSNYNTITENNITTNDDDGIGLDLSSHNTIHNNTITGHYQDGIVLDAYSDNNTLSQNTVIKNGYGIELYDSSNNTITQNNLTRNTYYGMLLYYSSNNTVSENNITHNDLEGIFLSVSHYNHINQNHIENSSNGLTVGYDSSNNTINENTITHNEYGIQILSSSNNTFCHNYLINNTNQVASTNSLNKWNCDHLSIGNYWSDYEERYPNATEIDGSGIWNTPYAIDENNQDNYPIIPEFQSSLLLPLFMALSLLVTWYTRKRP